MVDRYDMQWLNIFFKKLTDDIRCQEIQNEECLLLFNHTFIYPEKKLPLVE